MLSQVLSNPYGSLVPTSTLGLISVSDSLCDLAGSLSLSGPQFPRLYNGGVCLLRATSILSTHSLMNKGYDETARRMGLCSQRAQTFLPPSDTVPECLL